MVEPRLLSHSEKESLRDLNGWGADLGGCLIDTDHYYIVPKPDVVGLSSGQKWTNVNHSKSEELSKAADDFHRQGYKDNTVLTLMAMSTNHIGLVDAHGDRLSEENNGDLAEMVYNGLSKEIILALSTCSYYEHLAWFTGKVDGLENPNGVLVSLQVITADDKLVFAKRGNVSAGKNDIGVAAGGTLDYPADSDVPEPEDIAFGELDEELGVARDEANVRLITLMEDKYKRPVLFYRARLKLTSEELREKWSKIPAEEQENSELYFVDNTLEGLMKFAMEHSPNEFHAPADLIFQQALLQKIAEEKVEEANIMAGAMSS